MAFFTMKLQSQTLASPTTVRLFLPCDLENNPPIRGVITLLHGFTNCGDSWMQMTAAPRYAADNGLALVAPDCGNSFYQDMTYGGAWAGFVTEEMPALLRAMFHLPAEREKNFIGGLSMGGYGAWKLALGAGETFGAGASLSGALDIVEDYKRQTDLPDGRGELFRGIFGSEEKLRGSDNEILTLAEKLAETKRGEELPPLYAWCGTEDFLYEGNLRVWKRVTELGYQLTSGASAGDHQWKYWDKKIQDVLRWWLKTELDLE